MNNVMLQTMSVEDTQQLGFALGQWIHSYGKPICIALIGDLGTGKTHMSQGIAKGLGIVDEITSPTFALMNTYTSTLGNVYHFDLYRMDDISELENIGFYEYTEDQISIVEWADKFSDELPEDTIWVYLNAIDEMSRSIKFSSDIVEVNDLAHIGGPYVVGH